jgi:hypothetical protein
MAMSRPHSFVVLFPDIARAGPARDQTLISASIPARELFTS